MTTGENNTKELAVFSIKDHKIMTQFKDVQSFTIKNDSLTLYLNNKTKDIIFKN